MSIDKRTIYFARLNDEVALPYKRVEDGGYDIYANFIDDYIEIKPNEVKLIPTGLVSAFNPKWVIILKERGSTGTKGIEQRCGVIDSGFRGEWKVPITNSNKKTLIIAKKHCVDKLAEKYGNKAIIYPYEKAIAQAIVVKVPRMNIKETGLDAILEMCSDSGNGMLGSSNK